MPPKKKSAYDHTIAARQVNHLQRLADENGKRVVVDLSGELVAKLNELKESGYSDSGAGVVRRALDEAHAKNKKKR